MNKEEFIRLYEKQLNDTATAREIELLEQYQDDFQLFEYNWQETEMGNEKLTGQAIYERLREEMEYEKKQETANGEGKRVTKLWRYIAAAAVLILATVSVYIWVENRPSPKEIAKEEPARQQEIGPGGDRAVLTLADGSRIILDSSGSGILARQGSVTVIKMDNGAVAYDPATGAQEAIGNNTISTPKGGQYKLILPDGSEVWLNAASSLTFPTAFVGEERKVTLTGEGYFKVVHNSKQPFTVQAQGIQVHDLGTEFNINAYDNEPVKQATLVSGLARVQHGRESLLLQPGKMAIVTGENSRVETADLSLITAWKNGFTSFRNADIKTMMRQVERWYNITVTYEGPAPDRRFRGDIRRDANLSELLLLLKAGNIHYRLEGRQLIITP